MWDFATEKMEELVHEGGLVCSKGRISLFGKIYTQARVTLKTCKKFLDSYHI